MRRNPTKKQRLTLISFQLLIQAVARIIYAFGYAIEQGPKHGLNVVKNSNRIQYNLSDRGMVVVDVVTDMISKLIEET